MIEDKFFNKKRVLITGGTGTLGKALLNKLLSIENSPKKVIIFSRDEAKQHELRLQYLNRLTATDEIIYNNFNRLVEFRIGDVRNYNTIVSTLKDVDIVIHAAALKQVPTCEYFVEEAVNTNVIGAFNIINAIREHNLDIECVIGVSTDKACKPINAYGMTKALMEKAFISANLFSKYTRFILVRYGNVLNSRGSVIPLVKEQINKGGPVTITNHNMTRFFFTVEDAVNTIISAASLANKGEIFVPIINSVKIIELIKAIIGTKNISIVEIGIRPGEKLHEELISEEEGYRTYLKNKYYVIDPPFSELLSKDKNKNYINKSYISKDYIVSPEKFLDII